MKEKAELEKLKGDVRDTVCNSPTPLKPWRCNQEQEFTGRDATAIKRLEDSVKKGFADVQNLVQ